MQYLTFAVIGLVIGGLAGILLRGRHSIEFDLLVGLIGALAGGHLFLAYGADLSSARIGGPLFAAIGAFLFVLGRRLTRTGD